MEEKYNLEEERKLIKADIFPILEKLKDPANDAATFAFLETKGANWEDIDNIKWFLNPLSEGDRKFIIDIVQENFDEATVFFQDAQNCRNDREDDEHFRKLIKSVLKWGMTNPIKVGRLCYIAWKVI